MNDQVPEVKNLVRSSLESIGDKLPILTLCKGLQFLASTSRSNKTHRVLVMNLMTHVLDSKESLQIPKDVADALVKMSVSEIVAEKTISSEWQNSANTLLIAATRHNPQISAKLLLENFPQGKIPHYFIVKAMADFAQRYPKDFLPYLKDIMSRTLPLLGLLKHDNMKWVFAAALGRWSEAVVRVSLDYPEEEVDPREYSASVRAALQHGITDWLPSKQQKIRLVFAQGLGYMCYIVDPEEFIKVIPKLIPEMVKLLKKEKSEQRPVSEGIRHMARVIMRDCPQIMEEHFEAFLTTVHASLVATYKNEKYEKWEENFNELCFAIVHTTNTMQYIDRVISFIQKQIASPTPAIKIASLKLFDIMIQNCDEILQPYKDQLVSSLLMTYNPKEMTTNILYVFVDCVRSMAEFNYLQSRGGTELIQVVITGSSITDAEVEESKKGKDDKKKSLQEKTRDKCDKILTEMTSGSYAEQMDDVLWPFLMESFVSPQFSHAFVILCKSISDIAKRKKNHSNFIIQFDKEANLPKPDQLFARLIVALSSPFERNESGVNILRALYCLSPNLSPNLVDPCTKRLPQMKKEFLDAGNGENSGFDQDRWENAILSFVKLAIESVDDDQWNVSIGDALLKQAEPLYNIYPERKRFLLTVVGLIIQRTTYKEFVIRGISGIFNATNHKNECERLGCARGLGQVSQTHTDSVLSKLSTVVQTKEQKRGFFSKSADQPITMEAKATALLCYAYLCRLTPPDLLKSRVDVHVIANIIPTLRAGGLSAQKLPFLLKETGLTCLNFIGEAVTPDRISDYKLKSRDELISIILEIMQPTTGKGKLPDDISKQNYQLILNGLETLITLISLPPKMSAETQSALQKQLYLLLDSNANGVEGAAIAQDDVMEELRNLLSTVLYCDLSQGNLGTMIDDLEKYILSTSTRARKNGSAILLFLLKEFATGISEEKPEIDIFHNAGKYIGSLVPRLTESNVEVRRNALDSIYVSLRIQHYLSSPNTELPDPIQGLISLRSLLDANEPEDKLKLSKELTVSLCNSINSSHLQDLLKSIIATFNDVEEDGANGSCFIFSGFIRFRGKELEKDVDQFVKVMIENMNRHASRPQVVKGLLVSIQSLAKHFPLPVISSLLSYPVPHSKEVISAYKELAKNKELTSIFFDHVIDLLNNSQLYDEKKATGSKPGVQIVSVPLIDSATAALHETLSASECQSVVDIYYSKLVITTILRVGSANGITVNPPVNDPQICIKNLLKCMGEDDIIAKIEQTSAFDQLLGPDFPEGIQTILEFICKYHQDRIRPMFDFVKDFVKRTYLGQKISATAAVSVLLNNIQNDREMVNDAVNCLLNRSGLEEPVIVKLYAIRGLAKVHKHPKEILHRFLVSIMTSLIAAIEDKDEGIILESMTAIQKIFEVADDEYASPHLLNLCIRLKPSFEKDSPELRASSIKLFGILSRFSKGEQSDALVNQFYESLPTILLHLRDPSDEVITACKETLCTIIQTFGRQKTVQVVQDIDTGKIRNASNFETFSKIFSEIWVSEFPERISETSMNTVRFFESRWPEIAAGACMVLGFMIATMNDEQKQRINLRHNCGGMIKLLKNQNNHIRETAAKILGLLYEA